METEEKWLPVAGWADVYQISSMGRIRSIDRTIEFLRAGELRKSRLPGKILTPAMSVYGYRFVVLSEQPHRKQIKTIHIIVCEAFHGPKPDVSFEVAHLNGIRDDNRPENLRWVSPMENQAHRKLHGTHLEGESAPWSRLNDEKVREIRRLAASGMQLRDISKQVGVPKSNTWTVVHRKSWRHVA